jgi:triosephosphate isomerase
MSRTKHIVGNWKMNQNLEEVKSFFSGLEGNYECEAWIAPQAMHLSTSMELGQAKGIKLGAQNCAENNSGAFTGENSPASLKDLGSHFTLVGHSERRAIYGESDELLNAKTKIALENDLVVIFCVGETLEEREANKVDAIITSQLELGLKNLPADKLDKVLIAYEPVWAIGTGKVATPEQAEEVHAMIRSYLNDKGPLNSQETIILYGGSVKPSNVDGLLSKPNIDGALVGGASLKADSFQELCLAASKL